MNSSLRQAANAAEEFLGGFSGVLRGEALVQDVERDGRINFFQRFARRFAVDRLHTGGDQH